MKTKKQPEKQCRKSETISHLVEEHMELLDTIKEMVETEVNKQMEKMYRPKQKKAFRHQSDTCRKANETPLQEGKKKHKRKKTVQHTETGEK